jgi:hypothetical protein
MEVVGQALDRHCVAPVSLIQAVDPQLRDWRVTGSSSVFVAEYVSERI